MTTKRFQNTVWDYYHQHGRHDLPWRRTLDPYAIVVSEVMLQQTQVERVVPKFTTWLTIFPTWLALAQAPVATVLKQWQGLGYNRRALALQRCAQAVIKEFDEVLPQEAVSLLTLPGIGPYTSAAVQAFAFNRAVIMIETNIRTVFIHHFFPDRKSIDDDELRPLIEATVDRKNPREWYWALMDYGSFLKKQFGNPARRSRQYVRQSAFEGSNRQVRGAILRLLTTTPTLSEQALKKKLEATGIAPERIPFAVQQLIEEKFITIYDQRVKITPITAKLTK